jgi:hypothetical protein
MNAVKHGFAGRTVVLHEHEVADYKKHFQAFRDEYSPVGPTEEFLVQSLAERRAQSSLDSALRDRLLRLFATVRESSPGSVFYTCASRIKPAASKSSYPVFTNLCGSYKRYSD